MSNTRTSTTSSGVGILELLTVAFVILKLCHVIDWSWWWVLAPTWIPLALAAVILVICGIIKLIGWILGRRRRKQREQYVFTSRSRT